MTSRIPSFVFPGPDASDVDLEGSRSLRKKSSLRTVLDGSLNRSRSSVRKTSFAEPAEASIGYADARKLASITLENERKLTRRNMASKVREHQDQEKRDRLAEEVAREKQWVVILSVVQYARYVLTTSRQEQSQNVLSKLLVPIVKLKLCIQRRLRNALIKGVRNRERPDPKTVQQSSDIFRAWDLEAVEYLVNTFTQTVRDADSIVVYQNSPAKTICYIAEGRLLALSKRAAERRRGSIAQHILTEGSWVGLEELLSNGLHLYTIITLKPTLLWVATQESVTAALQLMDYNVSVRDKTKNCITRKLTTHMSSESPLSADILVTHFPNVFSSWSAATLSDLVSTFQPKMFSPGEIIQKEGTRPRLSILTQGKVAMATKQLLIHPVETPKPSHYQPMACTFSDATQNYCREGPCLIGVECFLGVPLKSTVVAQTFVEAWVVDASSIAGVLLTDPATALEMKTAACSVLQDFNTKLTVPFLQMAFRRHANSMQWYTKEATALLKEAQPLLIPETHTLVQWGEQATGVYFITKGRSVRTSESGEIQMTAGAVFGLQYEAVLGCPWTYTVKAVTEVEAWFIPRHLLARFLECQPPKANKAVRRSMEERYIVIHGTHRNSIPVQQSQPNEVQERPKEISPFVKQMLREWAKRARRVCLKDPLPADLSFSRKKSNLNRELGKRKSTMMTLQRIPTMVRKGTGIRFFETEKPKIDMWSAGRALEEAREIVRKLKSEAVPVQSPVIQAPQTVVVKKDRRAQRQQPQQKSSKKGEKEEAVYSCEDSTSISLPFLTGRLTNPAPKRNKTLSIRLPRKVSTHEYLRTRHLPTPPPASYRPLPYFSSSRIHSRCESTNLKKYVERTLPSLVE